MNFRQSSLGIPWKLFIALIAAGFAMVAIGHFFPSDFEHSTPELIYEAEVKSSRGESHTNVVVEFDVTNHTARPMNKTLGVAIGLLYPGGEISPPSFRITGFQEMPVALQPGEKRHLECRFPNQVMLPNNAEVTVVK